MGKNKLARWNELATFEKVFQPENDAVAHSDHHVKGKWKSDVFKNNNPVVLELGCGKGEYSVGLAGHFPEKNFIGIDIKGARMWRGAKTANELKMPNVAFLRTRIEFINSFFATDEVDEIWITFPDPHPGGRNSAKRLTSPRFLNLYRHFLKDKGIIHLKTDNTELSDFTARVVAFNGLPLIFRTSDLYAEERSSFPVHHLLPADNGDISFVDDIMAIKTHYEKIFLAQGTAIKYISFRLPKNGVINDYAGKTK